MSNLLSPLDILLLVIGLLLAFRSGLLKYIGVICLFVALGIALYFIVSPYLALL